MQNSRSNERLELEGVLGDLEIDYEGLDSLELPYCLLGAAALSVVGGLVAHKFFNSPNYCREEVIGAFVGGLAGFVSVAFQVQEELHAMRCEISKYREKLREYSD